MVIAIQSSLTQSSLMRSSLIQPSLISSTQGAYHWSCYAPAKRPQNDAALLVRAPAGAAALAGGGGAGSARIQPVRDWFIITDIVITGTVVTDIVITDIGSARIQPVRGPGPAGGEHARPIIAISCRAFEQEVRVGRAYARVAQGRIRPVLRVPPASILTKYRGFGGAE
jgi:hypothetical protein